MTAKSTEGQSAPKKLRHHMGRVEFLAIREEVEGLLKAGYGINMAYDEFYPKKISMSYRTFCNYVISSCNQ